MRKYQNLDSDTWYFPLARLKLKYRVRAPHILTVTILLLVAMLQSSAVTAEDRPVEMKPLPSQGDDAGPVIIGGQPARSSDWPATLIFSTPEGLCTSTAIGGRVILTAAHCVEDGATGTIGTAAGEITLTCRHHPAYAANYTADVAICIASADVPTAKYERVNARLDRVANGDQLRLLGYGCRQPGGGGPSQLLYEGSSNVDRLPTGSDYYTTTRGGAAVCFGDSGGAAFKSDGTLRFVMGINSRGDILSRSLLTTIAIPEILAFIREEAQRAGSSVCGLDEGALRCR